MEIKLIERQMVQVHNLNKGDTYYKDGDIFMITLMDERPKGSRYAVNLRTGELLAINGTLELALVQPVAIQAAAMFKSN